MDTLIKKFIKMLQPIAFSIERLVMKFLVFLATREKEVVEKKGQIAILALKSYK